MLGLNEVKAKAVLMADGAIEALVGNQNACWKAPSKNLKMKIKNKLNNNELELDATNIQDSHDITVKTIVNFLIKSQPILRDKKNNSGANRVETGYSRDNNVADSKGNNYTNSSNNKDNDK